MKKRTPLSLFQAGKHGQLGRLSRNEEEGKKAKLIAPSCNNKVQNHPRIKQKKKEASLTEENSFGNWNTGFKTVI